MYKFYEKSEAIREVQKFLGTISNAEDKPTQNGNYDDKTREGVIAFQKSMGIAPTGTVDFETFKLLYAAYTRQTVLPNNEYNSRQNLCRR